MAEDNKTIINYIKTIAAFYTKVGFLYTKMSARARWCSPIMIFKHTEFKDHKFELLDSLLPPNKIVVDIKELAYVPEHKLINTIVEVASKDNSLGTEYSPAIFLQSNDVVLCLFGKATSTIIKPPSTEPLDILKWWVTDMQPFLEFDGGKTNA